MFEDIGYLHTRQRYGKATRLVYEKKEKTSIRGERAIVISKDRKYFRGNGEEERKAE